jgi:hypothetical protein
MAQNATPERIAEINEMLLLLRKLWLRNPDVRFGQIADALATGKGDIFYVTDADIKLEMQELMAAEEEQRAAKKASKDNSATTRLGSMDYGNEVRF